MLSAFPEALLPLLTLSEDDADRQHLLIPLCPNRKVCGHCRSFGNGRSLSGRLSNCASSCGLLLLHHRNRQSELKTVVHQHDVVIFAASVSSGIDI